MKKSRFNYGYNRVKTDFDLLGRDEVNNLPLKPQFEKISNPFNKKYNVIEFEKHLLTLISDTYRKGRVNDEKFNPKMGKNKRIQYLVNFIIEKKEVAYTDWDKETVWYIYEKVYVGKDSFSNWKVDWWSSFIKVNTAKSLRELFKYIYSYLDEWDSEECSKNINQYLKHLESDYELKSINDLPKLLNEVDEDFLKTQHLINTKNKMVKNKSESVYKEMKEGKISEEDWIIEMDKYRKEVWNEN